MRVRVDDESGESTEETDILAQGLVWLSLAK